MFASDGGLLAEEISQCCKCLKTRRIPAGAFNGTTRHNLSSVFIHFTWNSRYERDVENLISLTQRFQMLFNQFLKPPCEKRCNYAWALEPRQRSVHEQIQI